MLTIGRLSIAGMAMGLLLLTIAPGMAQTRVELNGTPISFTEAPFQVLDRTMVPMRSIFEALGAEVDWVEATQTVTATKGSTDVSLAIGGTSAQIDGRTVALDVPAMIRRGSTMVPLRFVSEALGADVSWSAATQTVSILTTGTPYPGQWTDMQTVVIPATTVIPVSLDTPLSSLTGKVGDGFGVTVVSSQDGDAEFPRGTRLVGSIVGLQKADSNKPGILDLLFREAWMLDGSKVTLDGSVISLDDKSVTRAADGRLRARVESTSGDRLKFIGIGAGAGLIIGKLLDENLLVGGLLGAAAGYLYNEVTTDKVKPRDVVVKAGTVFGVRMDRAVSYSAPSAYVAAHSAYLISAR